MCAQIRQVRALYACDCKAFASSGWLCSHVLATMVIKGQINVNSALEGLPVRRIAGRPRTSTTPGDQRHAAFFTEDRLIKLFAEYPARPMHWNVMRAVTQQQEGVERVVHVLGNIESWDENNGRYEWNVRLSDGSLVSLRLQELAEYICESYELGVDIMGPRR